MREVGGVVCIFWCHCYYCEIRDGIYEQKKAAEPILLLTFTVVDVSFPANLSVV